SDPFSKRVLIGRGLDPILIRYSVCRSSIFSFEGTSSTKEKQMTGSFVWPVSMTVRFHLFPFRTQKLSSLVPKIVGWRRPVKIGRCRLLTNISLRAERRARAGGLLIGTISSAGRAT